MILPGTTMILTICLPSVYRAVRSSARAAFSASSLEIPAGSCMVKRVFPQNCTGIVISESTIFFSSHTGNLCVTDGSCLSESSPQFLGNMRSERRKKDDKFLQDSLVTAF